MIADFDGPIIDTHQHLWDLSRFHLPWTAGIPSLARTFSLRDYRQATGGLRIERTLYMEVDVAEEEQEAEARWALAACAIPANKMAGAVISGRPASPDFAKYLDLFRGSNYLKGVRQILHVESTPAGYCLEPAFVRGVQLLGERGLSFDLCMRGGELLDGDKLVALCPGTRFIVDHCGNRSVKRADRDQESVWKNGIMHLADHENVVCKISGIVASADEDWTVEDLAPTVRTTLDAFGPDRVMFAGDWPVCTLRSSFRQWFEALNQITSDLDAIARRKLFHDNAVKFYALPAA